MLLLELWELLLMLQLLLFKDELLLIPTTELVVKSAEFLADCEIDRSVAKQKLLLVSAWRATAALKTVATEAATDEGR